MWGPRKYPPVSFFDTHVTRVRSQVMLARVAASSLYRTLNPTKAVPQLCLQREADSGRHQRTISETSRIIRIRGRNPSSPLLQYFST